MLRCLLEVALFVTLIFFVSCAGVNNINPNSGSAPVGTAQVSAANGGEVLSPDGKLLLTIPPGALNEDTQITIQVIPSETGMPGYEFLPNGLVFNQPAIASMELDLAEEVQLQDENGEPLNPTEAMPFLAWFLRSADGSYDVVDQITTETEEGSTKVIVSAPIPHFTSLIGSVGQSYYAYLASLGTHYEGTHFKRDFDVRYLGYSTKKTYGNMSLSYLVKSVTVKKIQYQVSGAIGLDSPAEITRSDRLSKRGDTSSNRPKFYCSKVGDGKVKVTTTVDGIVDVTFQPENKNRTYSVTNQSVNTRKGKCLKPSFGFYQNGIGGYTEGEALVALADPLQDLHDINGEPAQGLELPGNADFSDVMVALRDENTLEAVFLVDAEVGPNNPEYLQYLSYNLGALDETNGYEGEGPYGAVASLLELEAIGPGGEFIATAGHYDPEMGQWEEQESQGSIHFGETGVSMLIPVSELGLNAETVGDAPLRLFSVINMAEGYAYAGNLYGDTVDL